MRACRSWWSKAASSTTRARSSTCRGSNSWSATQPTRKSIPGPRWRRARPCRPATRWRSAAVSPRRQPTGATYWCVSSPATTSSPGHGEMSRILIAEDEEALCAMCARALTMDGHAVKTAADGSEALDLLTREEGRFDLLLTDVRMPLMDGIALALNVARDFPNMTILLMTGYADQRERAQGLDALIHDVITKPFTLAALRAAVNEALTVKTRG